MNKTIRALLSAIAIPLHPTSFKIFNQKMLILNEGSEHTIQESYKLYITLSSSLGSAFFFSLFKTFT